MMKRTIVIGSIIVTMVACKGEGQNKRAEANHSQTRAAVVTPYLMRQKAPEGQGAGDMHRQPIHDETGLMRKIGVQVTKGKIIIDTGKSKQFFESLEREFHKSMEESVRTIEQHSPDITDLGIHIQKDKITVDLNRTAGFLKEWVETMKVLGEELDRSLAPVRP